MMRENPCEQTTFGYLSTLESAEHGFFGGYLLISPQGRPREFHCTAPVRPSRAQQILYGPTLPAYLLGEQIGSTLLVSSKLKPQLVIINQLDVFSLRLQAGVPVVLLTPGAGDESVPRFHLSGYQFELPAGFESDRAAVVPALQALAAHVDLAEPFDRIYEAIREAQRIGAREPEADGQAA